MIYAHPETSTQTVSLEQVCCPNAHFWNRNEFEDIYLEAS